MRKSLALKEGLSFSFAHMFSSQGLAPEDILALVPQMEQAQAALQAVRDTGYAKGHYAKDGTSEHVYFPRLGDIAEGSINTRRSIERLHAWGDAVALNNDVVIFLGIGGSYLGNKMLFDLFAGSVWNQLGCSTGHPLIFFAGNNMDATESADLYRYLERKAQEMGRPLRVHLVPISKSGTTTETAVSFAYFYERLMANNKLFALTVTVVTGLEESSVFYRLAKRYNWTTFAVPEGVGGRFSVFTNVGFVTAAVLGLDIIKLLEGYQQMAQHALKAEPLNNLPLMNAALKYLAGRKGYNIEIFMGYANCLKSVAEWYVQLLAESLGKRLNRNGLVVHYGRTPVAAVGSMDMHAQTQQHQDGARDKVVQFLWVEEARDRVQVPDPFGGIENTFTQLKGKRMHDLLRIAMEANAEALTLDGRMNALYTLPELTETYVGQLLSFLIFSVAYEAELANVDAYDQPGVEAYKKIMKEKW